MKSFAKFIAEARMTTLGEVTAAIAQHKKAGEILNQTYKDLYDQARRILSGDMRHVTELMLKHIHAGNKTQELHDLYYDWPSDSFNSLNKASRTLAKVKDPKFKDVVTAGKSVLEKWIPVAADLKDLKGKVVKATQKRAEAKAAAEKVMSGKKASSAPLIKIFESHMNEYIAMAEKRAKEFVDDRLAVLKKHDWDLDKVAPRPNSRTMGSSEYKSAQAKRDLYSSITKSVHSMRRQGEPDLREPNKAMIDRYIEMNKKGAEDAYKNFMEKMIQKIGKPVTDAKMTGNIWTNATLTVTTEDGEEQVWHTQMILNFSKYQKMFNQFPSRRKK
jgi:hypothetical protein